MPAKTDQLTAKQERFCLEYMVDLNATQAAIRAGYSAKSAEVDGCRLLRNAKVRRKIEALKMERQARTEIRADDVLRALYAIATVDPAAVFDAGGKLKPIHEIPEHVRKCLASVETDELFEGKGADREHIGRTRKIRFWDKPKALELLCKHLGLFEKDNSQQGATLTDIMAMVMAKRED